MLALGKWTSPRTPAELVGRLTQLIQVLVERAGVPDRGYLPPGRIPNPSLPFPKPDSAAIAGVYAQRPEESQNLLDRASRIANGRFDLLGFEELNFGSPVNWHLEPVTGRESPLQHWSKIPFLDANKVGDHKVIWELNRHHILVTLGQAWRLTDDRRFVATFGELADGWLDANPPKLGINWASSLEVAFRLISWIWAIHLFGDAVASELRLRMVRSLDIHARHIERYLSTWYSPNTHLTGEALGLLYAGVAFPELPRAEHWRKKGWKVLIEELARQVGPDGVYFEQSSWYQAYTVDFYLHALALAAQHGIEIPQGVISRVSSAATVLRAIVRPDGSLPLFGDDDGGRLLPLGPFPPNHFADSLAHACLVLDDPGLKPPVAIPASALWLIGETAWHQLDDEREHRLTAGVDGFPRGGWYVLRTAREGTGLRVLMRAGSRGRGTGAHSHADPLALEIETDGCPVVTDPGTLSYVGAARPGHRRTSSHATVTVDGRDAVAQTGPFKWAKSLALSPSSCNAGTGWAVLTGSHSGWDDLSSGIVHQRVILWLEPLGLLVLDRLVNLPDTFSAEVRFPLGPHVTTSSASPRAMRLDTAGASRVTFLTAGESDWDTQGSTCSPIYGVGLATKVLACRAMGAQWRSGVATSITLDGPALLSRHGMVNESTWRWGDSIRELEVEVTLEQGALRWQVDRNSAVNIPTHKRFTFPGVD